MAMRWNSARYGCCHAVRGRQGNQRKRIKDLVLFWHPDKFFSGYDSILAEKDQELITDLVLDISKELSRVLEEEG